MSLSWQGKHSLITFCDSFLKIWMTFVFLQSSSGTSSKCKNNQDCPHNGITQLSLSLWGCKDLWPPNLKVTRSSFSEAVFTGPDFLMGLKNQKVLKTLGLLNPYSDNKSEESILALVLIYLLKPFLLIFMPLSIYMQVGFGCTNHIFACSDNVYSFWTTWSSCLFYAWILPGASSLTLMLFFLCLTYFTSRWIILKFGEIILENRSIFLDAPSLQNHLSLHCSEYWLFPGRAPSILRVLSRKHQFYSLLSQPILAKQPLYSHWIDFCELVSYT